MQLDWPGFIFALLKHTLLASYTDRAFWYIVEVLSYLAKEFYFKTLDNHRFIAMNNTDR